MAQQIVELQTAAIQNAESIKIIASEMQHTIEALKGVVIILEKKLDQSRMLLIISISVSVLAFCVAVFALVR